MTVCALTRNGRAIANQFVKLDGKKKIFQSYDSDIAKVENGKVTLTHDWDYSSTTTKYLCQFLYEQLGIEYKKKDVQKAIDKGVFILTSDKKL